MELREAERGLSDDDPRRLLLSERLGMTYIAEHEWKLAHDEFLRALKFAGEKGIRDHLVADSYAGIGLCLKAQARYKRASQYLQRGLELGPDPEVKSRAEAALEESLRRAGEDAEFDDYGPPFLVTKILIDANWTENAIIRRHIPFKEGDTITARELGMAKASLNGLNVFKTISISTSEWEGGAKVQFALKDGWYVLPLPMIGAGAGGGRGGGVLQARNVFSQAEVFDIAVMRGGSSRRTAVSAEREGWSARIVSQRAAYTEHIYADGGYSSVIGLGSPGDTNDPERFGYIADTYGKTSVDTILAITGPIGGRWGFEWGFDRSGIGYNSPSPQIPPDAGKQGNMFAAVHYGGGFEGGGAGLGSFLGYGLADLDQRLRPLRRPRWDFGGEFRVIEAGRATASRFGYGEFQSRLQASYTWDGFQSFTIAVAGGHGASLPDAKLLATGRVTALQGSYSREYRGPTAAGANLSYGKRLHADKWGIYQGGVFAETARAWFNDVSRDKQGIGVTLSYRFWRFPLSLGVTYTYSLDDRNGLVSGAVGGRF